MCDCNCDITPIVEELKKHRPIIPAPGWRVFTVLLDTTEPDNVRYREQSILGWQVGDGDWFYLRSRYRIFTDSDSYILEPGEEFSIAKAFTKARNQAISTMHEAFKELTEAQKNRFRKEFPDVHGELSKLPVVRLEEAHSYLCLEDEILADEVGS